jgi:hypothetical protein
VKISPTMRRILSQVIAEKIGLYLIRTADAIIAQSGELQRAATERIQRTHATPAALAYRAKRWPNKKKRSITTDDVLKPIPALVVNLKPVPDDVFERHLNRSHPK